MDLSATSLRENKLREREREEGEGEITSRRTIISRSKKQSVMNLIPYIPRKEGEKNTEFP
jgi:hypothetical protein